MRNLPLALLPVSVNIVNGDDGEVYDYAVYVRYAARGNEETGAVTVIRCLTQEGAEEVAAEFRDEHPTAHVEVVTTFA